MSIVRLSPSVLRGSVAAPLSKSDGHRALIAGFLAGGMVSDITAEDSADIRATKAALTALKSGEATIDCNESGSTLRFLIPLAAALGKAVTFTGRGRLPFRPIDDYLRLLPEHGVACNYNGQLPLSISGRLTPGRYEIAGNISSQYITGLLLALPLLDADSEIILTSPLQSEPYVAMTLKTLRRFGINIEVTAQGYRIYGNQRYQNTDYTVEGDWSQAAFFLAGGALTGEVTVTGLDLQSPQGDKEILNVLRRFGAAVTAAENAVTVKKSALRGITLNVKDIPDLVPVIAVLGACAEGTTVIQGGERLRLKESDRISCVVNNLKAMGIDAKETADGMIIKGSALRGAALRGCNDHRIVMAFSIAALRSKGETVIDDAESIRKSYPAFFDDYQLTGGKADVISDR